MQALFICMTEMVAAWANTKSTWRRNYSTRERTMVHGDNYNPSGGCSDEKGWPKRFAMACTNRRRHTQYSISSLKVARMQEMSVIAAIEAWQWG